jgi:hypothetical protein
MVENRRRSRFLGPKDLAPARWSSEIERARSERVAYSSDIGNRDVAEARMGPTHLSAANSGHSVTARCSHPDDIRESHGGRGM